MGNILPPIAFLPDSLSLVQYPALVIQYRDHHLRDHHIVARLDQDAPIPALNLMNDWRVEPVFIVPLASSA